MTDYGRCPRCGCPDIIREPSTPNHAGSGWICNWCGVKRPGPNDPEKSSWGEPPEGFVEELTDIITEKRSESTPITLRKPDWLIELED